MAVDDTREMASTVVVSGIVVVEPPKRLLEQLADLLMIGSIAMSAASVTRHL